ncbi:flagellar protein FlaG [Herbaspirillum sp. alder98]|uniref:flagellar protein FlaG n=1 Tax=Herbaspirillum sp. alder98 TaxID=2913096 RepID=UPI001CD8D345|nr:flagellar protein FlaG [Herbaspirillum sp. alder98]MCA1322580.1 flagellar protein FlaG [Herbaspirillum sp. alder98]
MSITPLNNTVTGDSGTAYASQAPVSQSAPVASTVAVAATATPVATNQKPSEKEVDTAVAKLNEFAANNATSLNFSQDKDTGETVIKVIDTDTDKVLLQIPTVEAIAISKSIAKMRGLLLNDKA